MKTNAPILFMLAIGGLRPAAPFTDAADFGFLPEASGIENARALDFRQTKRSPPGGPHSTALSSENPIQWYCFPQFMSDYIGWRLRE